MKKICLFNVYLIFSFFNSFSATVDTVSIHSQSMDKDINCVVITPDSYYNEESNFPVVYLLHGYSDNYAGWIQRVPGIAELVDSYNIIVVCPDGGYDSWYWDSPINKNYKYETHIINEVIPFVDENFRTINDKKGRAISGLSMGGQGALFLAIRHQEVFGACGSQSGGVDIRPFPKNWGMAKWLGKYEDKPYIWEKQSVINMIYLLKPNSLKIIIDCGTEDFFFEVNMNLHKKLNEFRVPHDFIMRPGKHNWEYWRNSVQYHLLFFNNYFNDCK